MIRYPCRLQAQLMGFAAALAGLTFYPAAALAGPISVWAAGGIHNSDSNQGTIVYSEDSGATWVNQPVSSPYLRDIDFVDAQNGWVAGQNGGVQNTRNGGKTWASQNFNLGINDFVANAVDFVDTQNGWAVGQNGGIAHTSDGGTTWSIQKSRTGSALYGVSFTDLLDGWAVGGEGTILHTSNGGTTWNAQTSGDTDRTIGKVDFVDSLHGWATDGTSGILETTNGGATWKRQFTGFAADLGGIDFINDSEGWAVGASEAVLHTTDGGITWTRQDERYGGNFGSVFFADALNGWAAGDTIVNTTDGGKTWNFQYGTVYGSTIFYDVTGLRSQPAVPSAAPEPSTLLMGSIAAFLSCFYFRRQKTPAVA